MNMVVVTVVFALLGAAFGSFLAAWLHRFGKGASVVGGRSRCVGCRRVLAWYELLPLVSYAALRGTCLTCGNRISANYFYIELATTVVFATTAFVVSGHKEVTLLPALVMLVGLAALLTIFFFEWFFGVVLTQVVLGAAVALALGNLALGVPVLSLVYGALIGAGFFFAQWWVSRGRWVGEGDIWIGVFMGVLLGWRFTLLALLLAYVTGAAVAVVLLALHKVNRKSVIHFGIFLSACAWVVWLYGNELLGWYTQLLW